MEHAQRRPIVVAGPGPSARERFAAFDVVGAIDRPDASLVTPEMTEARALVTPSSFGAGEELIAALPNLELISCFGSGFEKVDLAAATRRGITVTNNPDANASDVADMAIGLLLASTRRIARADRYIRAGRWEPGRRHDLGPVAGVGGGRLGILGLGTIGTRIATRALGFELEVGYHNRRRRDDVAFPYFDSALALATWADHLVVACRADATNRHLVDAEVLRALGPRGHLINVSRGSVVDEAALADALATGVIEGAGLDVFEDQPNVHPGLIGLENVVMTPHIAGGTERALRRMNETVLGNLEAFFAGRPLLTPVPTSPA